MGITERKARQREEVRKNILTAAWEMVKKDGWQGLSVRKIADAIEYSVPVVYDHFENKDAIIQEFIREGFLLLARKMKEIKEQYTTPAEQLKAMAEGYWEFAFVNKEYYRVMYSLGVPGCETVKSVPEIMLFMGVIKTTIEELIASGKNPGLNIMLKHHTFTSTLHGLVSINMMGKSDTSEKQGREVLADAVASFIKAVVE
ncbi:TetR/AcrR family transcriptional regulator [Chitinophagaceae bacterium MMS25-I14]